MQETNEAAPSAAAINSNEISSNLRRQHEELRQATSDPAANVRRRCDEALQLSGAAAQGPMPDGSERPKPVSRPSFPHAGTNGSAQVQDQMSGRRITGLTSEAVQAAGTASRGAGETQQMRAAMLAIQLALTQQASSSSDLQRRMRVLEGRTFHTNSPESPSGAQNMHHSHDRSPQPHLHHTAVESPSGASQASGAMQGADSAAWGMKGAGRMLQNMQGEYDLEQQLPQHLLAMARMEAAMTKLHTKMELLHGFDGSSGKGQLQEIARIQAAADGEWEEGCWGGVSAEHASSAAFSGSGEQMLDRSVELGPYAQASSVVSLGSRHKKGPMHVRRQPGDFIARKIAAL